MILRAENGAVHRETGRWSLMQQSGGMDVTMPLLIDWKPKDDVDPRVGIDDAADFIHG